MADTHPNAFRLEAQEKRLEATRLNGEADSLEAQAEELDPTPKAKKESKKDMAEEKPALQTTKEQNDEHKEDAKKAGILEESDDSRSPLTPPFNNGTEPKESPKLSQKK